MTVEALGALAVWMGPNPASPRPRGPEPTLARCSWHLVSSAAVIWGHVWSFGV